MKLTIISAALISFSLLSSVASANEYLYCPAPDDIRGHMTGKTIDFQYYLNDASGVYSGPSLNNAVEFDLQYGLITDFIVTENTDGYNGLINTFGENSVTCYYDVEVHEAVIMGPKVTHHIAVPVVKVDYKNDTATTELIKLDPSWDMIPITGNSLGTCDLGVACAAGVK